MLRTLFIFSIFIPGFIWGLRDRFVALQMYLWFAFFRPQDWVWIDISGLRLSLVLGLALLVPAIFTGVWPNVTHVLSIGNILFLATALIAQFNAVNQEIGWIWIDFLVRLTLICLLSVTLITTPQRLLIVLAVISGSLGIHAAKAGVVSMVGGGVRFAEGLTGTFADNNGYALGTVMIMPLLLAVALNARLLLGDFKPELAKWVARGFYLAIPCCAFTVISTFSRGGFLALAAAAMCYIALHQRRVRLSLAAAAIVVLGLTYAPIPEGYFDRLGTITSYQEIGEESAISRTHFWQVAADMANTHPLGVGLWNYASAYDSFDFTFGRYGSRRAVHSSHFQVLAEQGYLGALIWCSQFALAFLVALRVRRRSRTPGLPVESARFMMTVSNCLFTSMIGFLVGGSFLALSLNDITWLTFALLAGLDRVSRSMVSELATAPAATPVMRTVQPWKPWRPAPVGARTFPPVKV